MPKTFGKVWLRFGNISACKISHLGKSEGECSGENFLPHHVLHLFHMLKLFPSVGTKVVKHYTTVEVHRSFPQGVVS